MPHALKNFLWSKESAAGTHFNATLAPCQAAAWGFSNDLIGSLWLAVSITQESIDKLFVLLINFAFAGRIHKV